MCHTAAPRRVEVVEGSFVHPMSRTAPRANRPAQSVALVRLNRCHERRFHAAILPVPAGARAGNSNVAQWALCETE
jgi:hypothetical protein